MTDIEKRINEFGLTEIAKAVGLDMSRACRRDYQNDSGWMVIFAPCPGDVFGPWISYWPEDDTVHVSQRIGGCTVSVQGGSRAVLAQLLKPARHDNGETKCTR